MKAVSLLSFASLFVIVATQLASALDFPPRRGGTLDERCQRAVTEIGLPFERCMAAYGAHPFSETATLMKDITPHQNAVFRYGAEWLKAHPEFEARHNPLVFFPSQRPLAVHRDDFQDYYNDIWSNKEGNWTEIDGIVTRKIPKSAASASSLPRNALSENKPNRSTKAKPIPAPSMASTTKSPVEGSPNAATPSSPNPSQTQSPPPMRKFEFPL